MNTIESCSTISPYNKTEECAKLVIDDISHSYVLSDIMTIGRSYTLSFWLKSVSEANVSVAGATLSSSAEWTDHTIKFTAQSTDLTFLFSSEGTYYIYHPQLEIGNKPSDYSPAPEDTTDYVDSTYLPREESETRMYEVESTIRQLSDSISTVVAGLESISFMEQTEDGWTFSLGSVQGALDQTSSILNNLHNEIGNTNGTINALNQVVSDLNTYVRIGSFQNEPCIELGAGNSDFKLLITNTRIMFMEGSAVPTYISNQTMYIDKLHVETELQQGDFVWAQRANGNLGLIWKEATS